MWCVHRERFDRENSRVERNFHARDIDCRSADLTLDIPGEYPVNLLPITELRIVRCSNYLLSSRRGKNSRRKQKKKKGKKVRNGRDEGGEKEYREILLTRRSQTDPRWIFSNLRNLDCPIWRVRVHTSTTRGKKRKFLPFFFILFLLFPSFFFFFFFFSSFSPTPLVTRQFVRALQGKWQFCTGEERQEIRKVGRDG